MLNDAVADLLLRGVTGKQYHLKGDKEYGVNELPDAVIPYKNKTGMCQSNHFKNLYSKYNKESVLQGEEYNQGEK